jgi:hypothetical protein
VNQAGQHPFASIARELGALTRPPAVRAGRDATRHLLRGVAIVAAGGSLLAGLVLVIRQVGVGLSTPAPVVLLVTVAAGIGLVKLADGDASGRFTVNGIIARGGLLLAVATLALPLRGGTFADWAARIIALVAAAVAAFMPPRGRHPAPPRRRAAARLQPRGEPAARPPRGMLRQRLERFVTVDGEDCLRGTLMIEVPTGGRSGCGHVGFCPTFMELPDVQVSTDYDEADVTVAAVEILPWGVRIECRLDDPAERPLRVPVAIAARGASPVSPPAS